MNRVEVAYDWYFELKLKPSWIVKGSRFSVTLAVENPREMYVYQNLDGVFLSAILFSRNNLPEELRSCADEFLLGRSLTKVAFSYAKTNNINNFDNKNNDVAIRNSDTDEYYVIIHKPLNILSDADMRATCERIYNALMCECSDDEINSLIIEISHHCTNNKKNKKQ